MKKLLITALTVWLGLTLCGCTPAPSFSPDGKRLAYVKGSKFVLRQSGKERVLSSEKPNSIAWSPDGAYLAWATGGETQKLGEKAVKEPVVTWIRDLSHGKTRSYVGVGGGLGWLNGDLIACDSRHKVLALAKLNPATARIRSETHVQLLPGEFLPCVSRRELYDATPFILLPSDDTHEPVYAFDGSHFLALPASEKLAGIPLGCGETGFVRLPDALPVKTLDLLHWDGRAFKSMVRLDVPQRAGKGNARVLLVDQLVGSTDAKVVGLVAMTLSGTESQNQWLDSFIGSGGFTFSNKDQADQFNESTKGMKESYVAIVWSHGTWKEVAELRNNDQLALAIDPNGTKLALCGDSGARIIDLK